MKKTRNPEKEIDELKRRIEYLEITRPAYPVCPLPHYPNPYTGPGTGLPYPPMNPPYYATC